MHNIQLSIVRATLLSLKNLMAAVRLRPLSNIYLLSLQSGAVGLLGQRTQSSIVSLYVIAGIPTNEYMEL